MQLIFKDCKSGYKYYELISGFQHYTQIWTENIQYLYKSRMLNWLHQH